MNKAEAAQAIGGDKDQMSQTARRFREGGGQLPWARYYTDAHVDTVLRRAVASGLNPTKIVDAMTIFSGAARIEGVHPLQFGYVRRKMRTQRRRGSAIVSPILFYPWRVIDFTKVAARWLILAARYRRIMKRVVADVERAHYIDAALRQ